MRPSQFCLFSWGLSKRQCWSFTLKGVNLQLQIKQHQNDCRKCLWNIFSEIVIVWQVDTCGCWQWWKAEKRKWLELFFSYQSKLKWVNKSRTSTAQPTIRHFTVHWRWDISFPGNMTSCNRLAKQMWCSIEVDSAHSDMVCTPQKNTWNCWLGACCQCKLKWVKELVSCKIDLLWTVDSHCQWSTTLTMLSQNFPSIGPRCAHYVRVRSTFHLCSWPK